MVLRRHFLAAAAGALAASRADAFRTRFNRGTVTAIADEIATSESEIFSFARRFDLQSIELRVVPETKKEFAALSEPELKRWSAALGAGKLRVSFLHSSVMKQADRRKEDAAAAIRAAGILGADRIGILTGGRRTAGLKEIVGAIEELIPLADAAKVKLIVENERTQNVATSAEIRDIMNLLPSKSVGFCWVPREAAAAGEKPWPDGYELLPKARLMNARLEASSELKAMMEAMQKDGYAGRIALDTDPENAYEAMKDMQRAVGGLS